MAERDYKRLSFSGCYQKKSVELACLIAFFLFSFDAHDLFTREIRHADKNRTGPNKLLCEETRSTFKFFCGQDVGYISHVGFT